MAILPRPGRADIHIHTRASDGLASVEEVMERASKTRDLDVIAITDHNTVESAFEAQKYASEAGVEVVIGSEVSSSVGHILGLWLTDDIPSGLSAQDTIAAIHDQGGIAVISHPFANRAFGKFGLESVGEAIRGLEFDALEVYNATPYMVYANILAVREYLIRGDIAAVGGSDAHLAEAVGKGITLFPGRTADELRQAILDRTTEGGSGFASRLIALRYLLRYPSILKQQSRNLDKCKPGESKRDKRS